MHKYFSLLHLGRVHPNTKWKKGARDLNHCSAQVSIWVMWSILLVPIPLGTCRAKACTTSSLSNDTNYSMYKLSWLLENNKKSGFFLKTNNFLHNQMTSDDRKGVNNRHCDLSPIQVQEVVMQRAFLRLPHRKCMEKFWLAVNVFHELLFFMNY